MNKAFEKILDRLEEEREIAEKELEKCIFKGLPYHDSTEGKIIGIKEAIEIVREVAKEYGNGWIPCSYRLPEIGERVLLFVYGRVHIGKRTDAKMFEEYDIFSLENNTCESTKRIESWMPLPIAPYQKGE